MARRCRKGKDGMYTIKNHKYKQCVGSRASVWHGVAYKTRGNLCKLNLVKNKWGRIVSKRKHLTAKREKRLVKHGFLAKKGSFGVVKTGKKHPKIGKRSSKRRTKKRTKRRCR